jgi:methionyl-tRNA synthetase
MALAVSTGEKMEELIRHFKLKAACGLAMDLAREGNRYFDQCQPWKTAKTDRDSCATCIYYSLQLVDTLRILFSPYVPFTCQKTGLMLGRETALWSDAGGENLDPGHQLGQPVILLEKLKKGFEKIMASVESQAGPDPEPRTVPVKEEISYDEFSRMDMRVGLIREVHDIDGADKLYRLIVDMGDHSRQLVAGMKPFYPREELMGRKVVVLVNLRPVTLRGVKSEGMVLASDGEGVFLLDPGQEAEPGDTIR